MGFIRQPQGSGTEKRPKLLPVDRVFLRFAGFLKATVSTELKKFGLLL